MMHESRIYLDLGVLVACGIMIALAPCPMLRIGACSSAIGYLAFGLIPLITRRNWVEALIRVQAIVIWVLILLQIMHIITLREFALGLAIATVLHLPVIFGRSLWSRKMRKKSVVKS